MISIVRLALSRGNRPTLWRFPPSSLRWYSTVALIGLAGLLGSGTARAGSTYFSSSLDEVNQHQTQGILSLYQGDHVFMPTRQNAVSGNVAIGFYDYEALSGTFGLTWQNTSLLPVGVGVGYAYLDAEFETRTWTINTQLPLAGGAEPWLMGQTVVGRQVQTQRSREQAKSIREFADAGLPYQENPRILVDDFAWTYGYLHLIAQARIWLFRPQLDLGYLFSWYSLDGNVCVNGDCTEPGDRIARKGSDSHLVWGVGLGLDLTGLRLFAGLRPHAEMGTIMARLTLMIF